MIWKTVSQKFRRLTSRNLTRKEENHLLLVRVLKKKKKCVRIEKLICTQKPGFGGSLVSWWIDSTSKDQPHSKIQQTDGKFHSQQKQWGH